MPLTPGSHIGVYRVIDLIGAGGMGEVYRAHDERLSRDVAIKILADTSASDAEDLARFEREARALAALNHPNIATIHGVEDIALAGSGAPPARAIVLELVEGESLEDRLRRGSLSEASALDVAAQIADALSAAHEKGIIHRDLKPANVKITPSGQVKVLDFGLARMVADSVANPSALTVASTEAGLIMGTPAYMAPEQAQGGRVDKRADIWAFGVVLYEMLTGTRPFRGPSVPDTLAAVLTADPDWTAIRPRFQPLLKRCLERDPNRRLHDLGDFRFLVELARGVAPQPQRRSRIAAGLASIVLLAVAAWGWLRPLPQVSRDPVHLRTMLPIGASVTRGPGYAASVAISPDGRTLVIAGTGRDGPQLYAHTFDRLEPTPIAGTERGSSPFFSWDGTRIGFHADGRLKRVPLGGGVAVDIVPLSGFPAGASWGPDDHIVFASGAFGPLHVVNASGGTSQVLTAAEVASFPEILPDGNTVLYESRGWIHVFDRSTGTQRRLVEGASPRYAAGHVILSRGTALLGAPFNLSTGSLTGPVVPLVEGVALERGAAGLPRHYAISRNGTLAFIPAPSTYELILVRPDGTERLVTEKQRTFENPRFSPDGHRLVVASTRREGEWADLWVYDLRSGTAGTRLTSGGGRAPVWSPDGLSVTYSHVGDGAWGIYERRADGTGDARQITPARAFHWLVGWTPNRSTLAYGLMEGTESSIMIHDGAGNRRLIGPGSTWGGRLSRDGRWLVYYLLESGNFDVYVTRFPEGGARWLIGEGADPTWGPDGNNVYYRSGVRLMAARVDKSSGVRVLSRRVVVEPFLPPMYDDYDVHPDGRTLALVRPAGTTLTREIIVVLDWFDEPRSHHPSLVSSTD